MNPGQILEGPVHVQRDTFVLVATGETRKVGHREEPVCGMLYVSDVLGRGRQDRDLAIRNRLVKGASVKALVLADGPKPGNAKERHIQLSERKYYELLDLRSLSKGSVVRGKIRGAHNNCLFVQVGSNCLEGKLWWRKLSTANNSPREQRELYDKLVAELEQGTINEVDVLIEEITLEGGFEVDGEVRCAEVRLELDAIGAALKHQQEEARKALGELQVGEEVPAAVLKADKDGLDLELPGGARTRVTNAQLQEAGVQKGSVSKRLYVIVEATAGDTVAVRVRERVTR